MGQAQSEAAAGEETIQNSQQPAAAAPAPFMDSILAEAAAYGDEEAESLDAKAEKALECPCIADLRGGPCGTQFSEAFLCFMKSTKEEKGSDCVNPFVALQSCIKANPSAFSKDVLEEDEGDETKAEEPKKEYRIIPPKWSRESPSPPPQSKL
ncbi:mitochondrial intermembrane space import and assembly protein 40 homolog isoform X1 [Punica granatum]|uniref:Mitochondrial intermembrane space import and assembly protein 40 homolog n=1 Tax=Punica granatum TaxID=22663 RepID=A0A6P8CXK5_PUNGR|nr:mitochondrial intermembrane space import and assembly protein 40 homolog isoform X1 [Punica granatum]